MHMKHLPSRSVRILSTSLLLALITLSRTGLVEAHAVVTESSLTKEPVKAHHPTEIVLFFNSNVELSLSKVFLVSEGDIYHPTEIARGKKAGELDIKLPPLEPGDYAIKYKVFAADGHLTESAIRFHVAR